MSSKNYLPKAYALLLSWLENFMSYVTVNMQRFDIPTSKVTPLQELVSDYQAAQDNAENPNSGKADRLVRSEKAAIVSKAVRDFVNANLRFNEAVTDDDRVKMGLTVPDPKPTPTPDPKTQPVVDVIDTSVIMRLSLHYKDSNRTTRAKPDGMHGIEIRWAIRDLPPTVMDDLMHSEFSTRTPYTFVFDEDRRGKTIWLRLRWENNRGVKGPWSELYSAIIP
jgi:hypothetical protein